MFCVKRYSDWIKYLGGNFKTKVSTIQFSAASGSKRDNNNTQMAENKKTRLPSLATLKATKLSGRRISDAN
jgi:hypothetical protein